VTIWFLINSGCDFSFGNPRDVATNNLTKKKYKILKRFPFSSELKRMSTIISSEKEFLGLTKGAPEVLKSMFKSVPKDYDETYKTFMMNGARVIALGSKVLKSSNITLREEIETDLNFVGFAGFPLFF
jgi:manganese-transporting P-type ATPase